MYVHQTQVRIPEDRIGVLIGKEGCVRKKIEEETGCKLSIMKDGLVVILCEDAIGFIKAQNVVRAIANGFNPEISMKLLKDDFKVIETINLDEYVGESAIPRIKGRIIGKDGTMRKNIEETLDVSISIHGKKVSIIGDLENVNSAREAILMLVEGSQHSRVLKFMEKKKRELKSKSLDWKKLM